MSDGRDVSVPATAGFHSRAEILSQPGCWEKCLQQLDGSAVAKEIADRFGAAREWLFIGCGSSYYIALAAASSWSELTGMRARSIPASELLLFPELIFAGSANIAPVVISRSGRTSEALLAAEFLESKKNIRTLALTCSPGQPLQQIASLTLPLLAADEQSTVMTRSFTSMLIALQYIAAVVAGDSAFLGSLRSMAAAAEHAITAMNPRLREFVAARQFTDYVYLGQGPFYGLACESALKVTEMSVSYAQVFHTLEFRHGPKSIVGPETLIGVLLSQANYDVEVEVLQEIKSLGGTTIAITNRADDRARSASDLLIEFAFDVPEFARLAPHVFAGQLLGLYTGLKKGFDPDNPRNLSRSVVLDDKSGGRPDNAAV